MNNITFVGNLTDNPELRYTQSGIPWCTFTIAGNRKWKDKAGEWQEETSFIDGTLWRDDAEQAVESLHKGDRVIAVGRIEQQSWTTKEGDKRSKLALNVYEIGPSLKYATAQVSRVQREATSAPQSNASAYQAREDYGPDEAPF